MNHSNQNYLYSIACILSIKLYHYLNNEFEYQYLKNLQQIYINSIEPKLNIMPPNLSYFYLVESNS